jgi:hypothetical protein
MRKISNLAKNTVAAFIVMQIGGCGQATANPQALQNVAFTKLDSVPSGTINGISYFAYGTFNSQNRMVASNSNGIFVSYLQSARRDSVNFDQLVIKRSTDGRITFNPIFTVDDASRAACLESDSSGNIFLSYSTNEYLDAYVVELLASESYTMSHSLFIRGAGAGKFSCAYQESTETFYLLGWSRLERVNIGNMSLIDDRQFFQTATTSTAEYPHLAFDPQQQSLYFAIDDDSLEDNFTPHGQAPYDDIRYGTSFDGGSSWGFPLMTNTLGLHWPLMD